MEPTQAAEHRRAHRALGPRAASASFFLACTVLIVTSHGCRLLMGMLHAVQSWCKEIEDFWEPLREVVVLGARDQII